MGQEIDVAPGSELGALACAAPFADQGAAMAPGAELSALAHAPLLVDQETAVASGKICLSV